MKGSASISAEHVGAEIANYRGVTVKVPQDEVVLVGFGDGDGPEASGADEAAAHCGAGGILFDAVKPFVDAVGKGGVGFGEPDQFVVGFRVHFEHESNDTTNAPLPQYPNCTVRVGGL